MTFISVTRSIETGLVSSMSKNDEHATQSKEDFAAHMRRRAEETNRGCLLLFLYLVFCLATVFLMNSLGSEPWLKSVVIIIASLGFSWFFSWRDDHSVQHGVMALLQQIVVVAIILASLAKLIF